ncbi:DUF3306 domain-containing protein [Acidimangrovimonas pyrenivorans]|uniref:DUF3306 domain-containing protein n=1 Tax=Acidimangrovimonas pyrenivorans TaxID=2030798 RepID=A0ABV7AK02_9RHOB
MADREGFAARWSRRKREVEVEAAEETRAVAPDPLAEAEAERAAREEEEANRLAAEAVDLDAVEYGDDFSLFLKRGVPDALRRKALRKFFTSDPLLANLDGLNDYDEDYNNPAHLVYKSSWDAVRGFLGEAEETVEKAGERLDEAGEALDALTPAEEGPAPQEVETEAEEAGPEHAAEAVQPSEETPEAPGEPAPRRVSLRRRLQG